MKKRAKNAADMARAAANGARLLCGLAGAAACAVSLVHLFRAAVQKDEETGGPQAEEGQRQPGPQAGAKTETQQPAPAAGETPAAMTCEAPAAMTKEEMIAKIHEMEPVLIRGGTDVYLGKQAWGDYSWGYFFNKETGLWEVFHVGERGSYHVEHQTGSEMQALKYLYESLAVLHRSLQRYFESEEKLKAERAAGLREFHEPWEG